MIQTSSNIGQPKQKLSYKELSTNTLNSNALSASLERSYCKHT